MSRLSIRHETTYRFEAPTAFGSWRLMMRPTDTHATRIIEASLELSPPGATRWVFDAYGNSVCVYQPQGEADRLRVVSHLLIDRYPAPLDATYQAASLIDHEENRKLVLAPYWIPATDVDNDPGFVAWLNAHQQRPEEAPLDFLKRLNSEIAGEFRYAAREAEGVQSPAETVALGTGACRDLAWLMIEALRRWGHPARFASGYLYSPGDALHGAGATHAWAEVFAPGLGWLEFDPTNGLVESRDLIRVAATRTPEEAAPMSGTTTTKVAGQLSVQVSVTLVES